MKSAKRPPPPTIDWAAIITRGTAFFGKPYPPWYFGARKAAWAAINQAEPWLNKVERRGADTDFLKACTFHIAELGKAYVDDPYRDSIKVSTRSMRLPLTDVRQGIQRIKNILQTVTAEHKKWDEAKKMLHIAPQMQGEEQLDEAFFCLESRLHEFIAWYEPPDSPQRKRGRPSADAFKKPLVGMHQHLVNRGEFARRPREGKPQ